MQAAKAAKAALKARLPQAPREGAIDAPWSMASHVAFLASLRALTPAISAAVKEALRRGAEQAASDAAATFGAQALAMGAPREPFIDLEAARSETSEALDARMLGVLSVTEGVALGVAASASYESARRGDVSTIVAGTLALGVFAEKFRSKIDEVATTETAAAWNLGMMSAGNQVARQAPLRKVWDSMLDRRVCSRCSAADREVVAWGERFLSGTTEPPAHTRCRCVVRPWFEHWPERIRYVDKPNEHMFDIVL